MIQSYECGGLKMIDMKSIQNAMLFKWIRLLQVDGNGACRFIPRYYLDKFGPNLVVFKMNTSWKTFRGLPNYFPSFYKHLLKTWLDSNIKIVSMPQFVK